ncbi:MAG: bifunctional diaminohydroxyphosphoribosylaminopyrimidine deaminase/5-amino-6-(5-phosphoribosylamino)uracil reductase RibD [Deferribacteraceae bacterium]|jgi:diaminohydroxyphosphoribosylaminopyrimidine deaminase/5-amino-6-(5-phosphoribosylamino)uracil reductase|nr:bifunctional diaminohydroxyphosphoribosylaminopyrimidine deaminase/5-amino-6-(5-phosphoribosylamino)uracil reductase RibD [Deferribacteraceae bacterium]
MKSEFMREAAALAVKGKGFTKTNPCVGAVLVKNGNIISSGWHEKFGRAHAEKNAILRAGSISKECELFVTLEPCSTSGKTPPCTKLIKRAGIKKVYIGTLDPNPAHRGRGVQILKDAGIEVEVGIEESLCKEIIEDFRKYITTRTPYVTLKIAQSLDGKIATALGESQWITSEASRIDVHSLRNEMDAVLTGIKTVLADNPHLTPRPAVKSPPLRVVLDAFARLPLDSNVADVKEAPTILYTGRNIDAEQIKRLNDLGIETASVSETDGLLNLNEVLDDLGARGIMNLLVEGGAGVFTSFLERNLADRLLIYTAPILLGGSFSAIGGFAKLRLKNAPRLENIKIKNIEGDIRIEGKFVRER